MTRTLVDEHYPLDPHTIPSSWVLTTVGDALPDIRSGYSASEHNMEKRGILHLRPGNLDRNGRLDVSQAKYVPDSLDALRITTGDVAFNNTNSPELVGKTAPVTIEATWGFSNHITRIRPGPGLSNVFVAHQLHYLWMTGYFRHRCTHYVNQASISATTLADTVPFIVPPTEDQLRINSELEVHFARLDQTVASLERAKANEKDYRNALLAAAYRGTLLPAPSEPVTGDTAESNSGEEYLEELLRLRRARWEEAQLAVFAAKGEKPKNDAWKQRYPEPFAPSEELSTPLPAGWTWATLDQLSDATQPITYGVVQLGETMDGGVPTLRSSDVRRLRIDLGSVKRISPRIAESYQRTILQEDDVLVTIRGTMGGVASVPRKCAGFNISREVARIVPLDRAASALMAMLIAAPTSQVWLKNHAHGIAYTGVNIEDLRKLPLPIPPPAEQHRIVADLSRLFEKADLSARSIAVGLAEAPALRMELLRKAFTGALFPPSSTAVSADELVKSLRQHATAQKSKAAAERKDSTKMVRRQKQGAPTELPRRSLLLVLSEAKSPLKPDALFREAGFNEEVVDEFFTELRELEKQKKIVQDRDAHGEPRLKVSP
ncbi:restriction endonuclease subunit S [Myxococcus sp. AM009]|uniref:restriction endonuclease subunit S n=1 Tax=Myxococcus sp. AM009 TaxID=2745137 RepID=UPI0015962389|nr:restriction endonuclease subunit S [Myxococcus sp. AM009]NVI99781.1 restriction endonuclease subunit S [Myxococcus sp. AM009]